MLALLPQPWQLLTWKVQQKKNAEKKDKKKITCKRTSVCIQHDKTEAYESRVPWLVVCTCACEVVLVVMIEVGEGVEESEELEVDMGSDVCRLDRVGGDRVGGGRRNGTETEGSEAGGVGEKPVAKGRIVVLGSKPLGVGVVTWSVGIISRGARLRQA